MHPTCYGGSCPGLLDMNVMRHAQNGCNWIEISEMDWQQCGKDLIRIDLIIQVFEAAPIEDRVTDDYWR